MPEKIKTELQIARVLGASPLYVELLLLTTSSYKPKNTSQNHIQAFYTVLDTLRERKFHGLIITGAPIEHLRFEDVSYWYELLQILDWANKNVLSTFTLCWGAQAALYHWYRVPKYNLPQKKFGIYRHFVIKPRSFLVQGMNDVLEIPVSRYAEVRHRDVHKSSQLDIVLDSQEAGLCLLEDEQRKRFFMLNHLEYDTITLLEEYERDLSKGKHISLPDNYFPGNTSENAPLNSWRASGYLLFGNWLRLLAYSSCHTSISSVPQTFCDPS